MIRRYLARRKMRWAVRWIKRHRRQGYRLIVGRVYGKRAYTYENLRYTSGPITTYGAITLMEPDAQD